VSGPFNNPGNPGAGAQTPSWFGAGPVARARPTEEGKKLTAQSAIELPAVKEITLNGVTYRGEPWTAPGRLIVPASNNANDASGSAWATAEGISFAEGTSGVALDCATFEAPRGVVCCVNEVDLLLDSEIAWQLLRFAIVFGGSSGTAMSGQQGRVLNLDTTRFVRPPGRNKTFEVWKRPPPGATVRLQCTNTSLEGPHLVECEIRGVLFPEKMLEGKEGWGGK